MIIVVIDNFVRGGNNGAFFGNGKQLGVQILGIVMVTLISVIITAVVSLRIDSKMTLLDLVSLEVYNWTYR
jgi:ammonia channel protein AmtB